MATRNPITRYGATMSDLADPETPMRWIDHHAHAISDASYRRRCAEELDASGALVLPGFFNDAFIASVLTESTGREDEAFFARDTHNIWLTPNDESLGTEHIFNRQIQSSKGLLADDQLAADSPLREVYGDRGFLEFIASVVGEAKVYPYADELSSINVHFHRDGEELGWHFDNSSFAVTALIQAPERGGRFEYVRNLRDSKNDDQNYPGVANAVDTRAGVDVLHFAPGALVVFRGRDSMHRVTPTTGSNTRILVVLALNTEPGITLSASARKTFYGRD